MTPGTSVLARNMVRAVRNYRAMQWVLYAMRLCGPSTTQELFMMLRPHVPHLSNKRLQRILTVLRKRQLVRTYRYDGRVGASTRLVFWALPGQPKPDRRLGDRRHVERVSPDRRHAHGSWWATSDRAGFTQAMQQRWKS